MSELLYFIPVALPLALALVFVYWAEWRFLGRGRRPKVKR